MNVNIFNIFFLYYIRILGYFSLIYLYILCFFLVIVFNKSITWYQVLFNFYNFSFLQISYIIGIDGLSIYFILLCSFLLMYCLLIYWFLKYKINLYIFTLLLSLWLLLNIFASLDLFFFYIYFEGVIIPMFLLIAYEVVVVVKFMLHINFFYILYLVPYLYYYHS